MSRRGRTPWGWIALAGVVLSVACVLLALFIAYMGGDDLLDRVKP